MFEWIKSGFGPAIRIALSLACVFQPIALPAESVAVRYREGVSHGFLVLRTPDWQTLGRWRVDAGRTRRSRHKQDVF
jgi:hypothetical protein